MYLWSGFALKKFHIKNITQKVCGGFNTITKKETDVFITYVAIILFFFLWLAVMSNTDEFQCDTCTELSLQ